jgi:hypothetical protein
VLPGTRFELEKMPVANGIWQPKHFAMKSSAEFLFLFRLHTQETETYFDNESWLAVDALAASARRVAVEYTD